MSIVNDWFRVLGLAAISGSRAMLGPAVIGRRRLRGARGRTALSWLAAGELLGDKLPWTPSRLGAAPLLGRAASGALVAVVQRPRGGGRGAAVLAAVLGASAAVAGAHLAFHFRAALSRRLGSGRIANAVTGAAEDALVLSAGFLLGGKRARPAAGGRLLEGLRASR